MVRATIDLHMAGEQDALDRAAERLSEQLAEAGFIYDEDFEALIAERGRLAGLRIHTLDALTLAVQRLPDAGAYMVQTNPEAV